MLSIFDERIYYNWFHDDTLFLTVLFWLHQHFGIDKNFCSGGGGKKKNITKDSSKFKKKKKIRHRSTEKDKIPVFLIASVNPAFLTVSLPICCRTKTNRVKNNLFLSCCILHLNEWCQACPIWWQVFIYCFTDNILHRVTLEVKSPDRTLFGLVGDRGGKMNILLSSTHCKQLSNI